MIKARGEGPDGRKALILGLSHANLDMLRAGKPIRFDATPYGFAGEIMIFSEQTERSMAALIVEAHPTVKVIFEQGENLP